MYRRFALLAILFLSGCVKPAFEPGDRVVARYQTAFWEGTVISLEGKLVTVQWDAPPPERSGLPRDWVVKVDSPVGNPAPGSWLICPATDRWELCQLKSIREGVLVVSMAGGDAIEVKPNEALPIPSGLVGWTEREGPRQLQRARAAESLASATPATAGKQARTGGLALARWSDGNWWESTIGAVTEETVTAKWADGSEPSPLDPGEVAPMPPYPEQLEAGSVAFCRWKGNTQWFKAVIENATAANYQITYDDKTKATVRIGECVAARIGP
jgi:hypothetical protein